MSSEMFLYDRLNRPNTGLYTDFFPGSCDRSNGTDRLVSQERCFIKALEKRRMEKKPETKSRVCTTVESSPNPSSVYIRLCKHRKKVFYWLYKINFPRKNAKLFVMALIKREILTSRKVLYRKSCTRNQFLFCKKMLSKMRISLA